MAMLPSAIGQLVVDTIRRIAGRPR